MIDTQQKSVAANSSFLRNDYSTCGWSVSHIGLKNCIRVIIPGKSKKYDETKSVPQGVSKGVKIVFLNGYVILAQIRSDYGKIINSKN
jgi:hypothetical protein